MFFWRSSLWRPDCGLCPDLLGRGLSRAALARDRGLAVVGSGLTAMALNREMITVEIRPLGDLREG